MGIFTKEDKYKPQVYGYITDPLIFAMWDGFWTHRKFNFVSDKQDYLVNIDPKSREVIKRVVLLISTIEFRVKSYWSNIGRVFPRPEIADMGAVFSNSEVIHARSYSQILEELGLNNEFEEALKVPAIINRVKYLSKYVDKVYRDDRKQKCYSLALFTLFTEHSSLFWQFYVILGYNAKLGLFKDMSNVVQYTSKEEAIHSYAGIALLNQVKKEYPEIMDEDFNNRIYDEAEEAYEAECALIDWVLENGFENSFITKNKLKNYVAYRLNDGLSKIGLDKIIPENKELTEQTFWMEEEILAPALTDFFSKDPIEYQKNNKTYKEEDLF